MGIQAPHPQIRKALHPSGLLCPFESGLRGVSDVCHWGPRGKRPRLVFVRWVCFDFAAVAPGQGTVGVLDVASETRLGSASGCVESL